MTAGTVTLGPLPRAWTTIDKSGWGPGPWQDEPDKLHWIDPATDLDCLMVRQPQHGAWCGYVAVPEGHPWFGKDYADIEDIDVHGGLTFAEFCAESDDPATGICHVPLPGRPDRVWWFGFDCHHYRDLAPAYQARHPDWPLGGDEVYRDRAYVEAEVAGLARQLRAAP